MALSEYKKTLQTYLEDSPLIVLGSGASIPYGLPSMKGLAQKIKELDDISSDEKYDDFCEALNKYSLEEAMDSVHLQQDGRLGPLPQRNNRDHILPVYSSRGPYLRHFDDGGRRRLPL